MNKIAIPTRDRSTNGRVSRFAFFSSMFLLLCIAGVQLAAQNAASPALPSQPASPADPQQNGSPTAGQPQRAQLPDAPQSRQSVADQRPLQTKRILGIIPNFRAVSTTSQLTAQSVKEKFITCTQDSFDYSSIFVPAALAGYSMGTGATPEFGGGAAGYGRYFWHAAVDQTAENYMVEFIFPVATHEDTRFYTLQNGSFLRRAGYALSRAVVTRSDSGKEVFNISEVVGAGASAGLSNAYYPAQERSLGNTGKQWGIDVGIDGASMFVKEFWPDINRFLFHGRE